MTTLKLLVSFLIHRAAASNAGCTFDAEHLGGIRLNVSTRDESSEAGFSLVCLGNHTLTLCSSSGAHDSMQFCVTDDSDLSCPRWYVDCLNRNTFGQQEHHIKIKTIHFGLFCFHVGFRNTTSSGVDQRQTLNVFSRDPNKEHAIGGDALPNLDKIFLGVLNIIVGFSVDVSALRKSLNQFMMDTLTLRLLDPYILFGLGAWKVGLVGQLLLRPGLAALVGMALFPESGDCSQATVLLRAGLLVLATAPIGSAALYFTLLFRGDINLIVLQSFVGIALSPLSMLLWWRTLGLHLQIDAFDIPLVSIALHLVITLGPTTVGMILAWVFPEAMAVTKTRFGRPVLAVGILFHLILVYTTGLSLLWSILTWRHVLAGLLFPVSVMCVVAAISASIGLSSSVIVTLMMLTGMPSGAIAFTALHFNLPAPEHQVAATIGQAYLFLSNTLLLTAYVLWRLYYLLPKLGRLVRWGKRQLGVHGLEEEDESQDRDSLKDVQQPLPLKSLWLQKEQIQQIWM